MPKTEVPTPIPNQNDSRLVADLQRVLQVSQAMSHIHDLNELLGFISDAAIEISNSDRGTIFLVDHKTNELFCRISDAEMKEIRFPVGVGIAGKVAETGENINIPDAYADARFNQDIDRKTGYKTQNLLTMPMISFKGKVMGVVQVLNKKDGNFTEYDETVLAAMASNAGCALETAQLLRHLAEKERIQAALQVARDIQQEFLPTDFPEVSGYDIFGRCKTADETGGDYFDVFMLPDGQVCSLVGDVSGHGVGSALLMATTRAYLKAFIMHTSDMSTVLEHINTLLEQDSSDEKFMTMFMQVMNPDAHEFYYLSAGHDEPLYWKHREGEFKEFQSTGLPLGIMPDVPFDRSDTFSFDAGDYLMISTDGIWEAPDADDNRFGRERLEEVLRANDHLPAEAMVDAVIQAVEDFVGADMEQADDLTVLIIKRAQA